MNVRQCVNIAGVITLIAAGSAAYGQAGTPAGLGSSDGLVEIKSSRLDHVYVRPGTDFRRYTRAVLGQTEVAFSKNWLREMNTNRIALFQGTSPAEAEQIAHEVNSGLQESFGNALAHAGYAPAAVPGPDVLEFFVRVTDLYVNAPRSVTLSVPTSRVYTNQAGEATLTLEVRDSSGTLLMQIVDRRIAGDRGGNRPRYLITSPASNAFNFDRVFADWANYSLEVLKAS